MKRGTPSLGFHSLGFKLFGALALFVVAPTILLVSLSDFTLRSTITEEIGKSAVGKLRVAHSIETILDDLVKNLGMRITMNPDLKALSEIRHHADLSGVRQYAYLKYLDVLDDSVQTNPLLRSIEIVFEGADYVLSTAGGVVARGSFDDEAWLSATTKEQGFEGNGTFLPPHVPGAGDGPVLSYYFPFPPYLTDMRGAVILHVYEREFSRMVNNPDHGTEGTVTLVDDHGLVISHVDKAQVGRPWEGWDKLAGAEGQGGITVGRPDGEHLVTWYRPDRSEWTYVGDFPLAALTRNVGTVRLVTALLSLAVVVVGVVLSYLLARRFFHPVRRLIRDLNRRLGTDEDAEGNELGLLSGAFDLLLKRETQLFHDLESQQRVRDQEWAGRTLRGEGDAANERPRELRGTLLFSGTLLLDGYAAFTQNFPAEQREYLRSVLLHMAEQAFLPEITCLGTIADPRSMALLLATDLEDGGAFADRVDEGFERLAAEALRLLGTSITLCLGTRGSGSGHWSASAAEAQALSNHRFLHGPGHWFWAENTCDADTPFFPLKTERTLLTALEAADPEAAASALEELRLVLLASRGLGYDNALLILHQLVGGIVKHLVERRIDLSSLFGRGDLHRTLSEAETLDEAIGWLRGVVDKVFAQGPAAPEGYVPRMIRFIRDEFHRDFGVEDVAAAAGLSYSHARRVFEEEMGESIVDYTNALRIDEAKRLLTATGASLDEIAVVIGYNNVQSFQRYFKKLAGVTPGGYRVRQK